MATMAAQRINYHRLLSDSSSRRHSSDAIGLGRNRARMRSPQEGRAESFRAVLALLACFNVGLCVAVIGPTLPDIQTQTGAQSFAAAVTVVSANAGGMIIGLLFATACFAYMNVLCVMAISLVLGGVLTAALPWPTSRPLVVFLYAGQGVFLGFLLKGAIVMYQVLWKRSPSMLHALYAVMALGGLVATLTTTPFAFKTLYPLNFTQEQNFIHDNTSMAMVKTVPSTTPAPDLDLVPAFLAKRDAAEQPSGNGTVGNSAESSDETLKSEGNSNETAVIVPKKPLVSTGSDPGKTRTEIKLEEQAKIQQKKKEDEIKQKQEEEKQNILETTVTPTTTSTVTTTTAATTTTTISTTTTAVITTTKKSIRHVVVNKATSYWSSMRAAARIMSRTQFAYVLIASCSLVSAGVFMTFCLCIPCRSVAATQKQDAASLQTIDTGVLPSRQKLYVWATLAGFAFCTSGVDALVYNILTVYAIVGLPSHLDQASGSLLAAFYWAGMLIGRIGLGPGCCGKSVKPKAISCLAVALLSSATLAMAAPYSMPAVWLGYGVLGIGLGPVLPLVLSHVDSSVNLSPWFMSSTLVAGEFGRFVVPVAVAAEMGRRAPVDFLFAQLVLVVAVTLMSMGVFHTAKAASALTAVNSFSATLDASTNGGGSRNGTQKGGNNGHNINVSKLTLDEEDDIFDLQDVGVYSPKPDPRVVRTEADGAFDAYFGEKKGT